MQEKYCKLLKEVEGDELFNDCASFKVLYSYVVDLKKSFNNPFSKIYDFPAVALYSEDEYYKEHPEELKVIADKLLASVNGRQIIKGIIDYRRHTYTKFILPREWTDGRDIRLTSIFIQKLGLPFYYVNSRILPIVKTPEEEANLVALSKDFWSEAFIAEFINCQDDFAKEVREKYHLR